MNDDSNGPSTPQGSPSKGGSQIMDAALGSGVDKEGYLTMRKGKYNKKKKLKLNKKWLQVYVTLIEGSVHWYQNQRDEKPKGSIDLKDTKIENTTHEEFKALKYVFSIINDKGEFILKADDETAMEEWVTALKAGLSKEPHPPLQKKSGKVGLKDRMERNVIGHAATSPLGKRAIRAKAPKEVVELIAAMKVIVEKESGSAKKANEIEQTIFKLGIKIFYLIQKGQLKAGDALVADEPLRNALDLFIRCRNHVIDRTSETRGRRQTVAINTEQLREKLEEVCQLVYQAADLLKRILEPHLTAKSLKRIDVLVAYGGDPYVLYKIIMDRSMHDELYELVSAGEHYSQFHFYADD